MKKDIIKKIATEMFANKGYDKCSMQEIADAVGFNKASLYFYFKSKEQLYICIFEDIINLYKSSVSNALHKNKSKPLYKILLEIINSFVAASTNARLLLWKKANLMCLSNPADELRQTLRDIYEHFNTDIYNKLTVLISEKSGLPPDHIDWFIKSYYIFTQSFLEWMLINESRDKQDVSQMLIKMWDCFWNGNKI